MEGELGRDREKTFQFFTSRELENAGENVTIFGLAFVTGRGSFRLRVRSIAVWARYYI